MAFTSPLPPDRTRRVRPVLMLLASLVFVLTVLNVSTFARHAGMQEMDQVQRLTAMADTGPAVLEGASPGHELAAGNPTHDAMRLMHAVGACLLLIAGAVVLLLTVAWLRRLRTRLVAHRRRRDRPSLVRSWRPPALSPPVLSPVLRT